MTHKLANLTKAVFTMTFLVLLLNVSLMHGKANAASQPGCYKITNGNLVKLTCPTSKAIYDDGTGANLLRANASKCYIYSANLYDGDSSWGEPYVQVDCNNLSPCAAGSELRYSNTKRGSPECVQIDTPTSGTFAGGAQPARSVSGADKVTPFALSTVIAPYICGNDGVRGNASTESENENEVHVAFNFGCVGDEYDGALNPIVDVAFAIFRFLSAGVGLIVIGSVIVAGIQYTTSRGNPQATQAAIKRMTSAVIGLVIFMFIFSIANFLIPGGMFIS